MEQEIKKKEEAGGGGSGGGGWFGWGGRFGWSGGDNVWSEAHSKHYLLSWALFFYSKGDLMLAVILNPLLNVLRGTRNGFSYLSSKMLSRTSSSGPTDLSDQPKKQVYVRASTKESVLRKWGSN